MRPLNLPTWRTGHGNVPISMVPDPAEEKDESKEIISGFQRLPPSQDVDAQSSDEIYSLLNLIYMF